MFHLYRIYNLQPVIHENLRPEKPQTTLSSGNAENEEEDDIGGQSGDDVLEEEEYPELVSLPLLVGTFYLTTLTMS